MIEAAGGVIWRTNKSAVEVLVVHRPRRDDWSLPKGKLYRAEKPLDAALREVLEETGLVCEVGAQLPDARYLDRKGRPKRVRYWEMRVLSGRFRPNIEVDETRWIGIGDASAVLTYDHDHPVVVALAALLAAAEVDGRRLTFRN